MISEKTLREIQAKAKVALTDLSQKVWENKWIVIPAAIIGYGLIKNKVTLKSIVTNPKPKVEKLDAKKATERSKTPPPTEKKHRKNRVYASSIQIQAKLGHSMSFQEESLLLEDISTSCQSDKELSQQKTPPVKNLNLGTNSGYHSDVDSVVPEDEMKKEKTQYFKKSENPDDLFFNIFQHLQ